MSFEDETRELAAKRQEDFNRRDTKRKGLEKAWEEAKNTVIKPLLDFIVGVTKDYGYMTGECACENNGCILKLETGRAKPGEKSSLQLRFDLDYTRGQIKSSSDFNGEHFYDLKPVDVSAIEGRVRFFLDAFLKNLDAD